MVMIMKLNENDKYIQVFGNFPCEYGGIVNSIRPSEAHMHQ